LVRDKPFMPFTHPSSRTLKFAVVLLIIVLIFLFSKTTNSTKSLVPIPEQVENRVFVVFETSLGPITFKMHNDNAPLTSAQILNAIDYKYYEGCHFYRFEENFVLQGGCFHAHKTPLPTLPLEYSLPNIRGAVSMARTSDPNSATSEFAIQLADNSQWLGPGGSDSHGYAVFMTVESGWETIEQIMAKKKDGLVMILDVYRKERSR